MQEPRSASVLFAKLFGRLPDRGAEDTSRLRSRVADFLADDQSGEDVRVQYDNDPDRRDHRIADAGGFPESDANGIVEGTLRLSEAEAQRLLTAQASTNGWLTYHAVSADHTGTGRVRLIGAAGVSVVSDIDDTIKITEIPAGPRVIAINTFYREFAPTTELRARYKALGDAAFHYVSGGPWQMYRPVSTFLIGGRHFPEGTFHMRTLSNAVFAEPITTIDGLSKFVVADGTFEHKVERITELMRRFPERRFVLIGDSGEQDPEIYRRVQSLSRAQVQEIVIRDVTNARVLQPDRLEGMTVVEAPTVVRGVSQFPR